MSVQHAEAFENPQTIVVGGGLAGLAAATYLARGGRRVTLLERAPSLGGRAITDTPHGYVLSAKLNVSHRAVHLLLDRNIEVRRATAAGDGIGAGDFIVTGGPASTLAEIAKQTGVDFVALNAPVARDAPMVNKPRIAMYQRYGGGNSDEGWTRLMFEQFSVPFTSIMDAEIRKGGLEARYDVIILPADSVAAMTGVAGAAEGGRGGARGGRGG